MNKTELIAIAAENAGLTKKDTERVLNAAIDAISLALIRGEKVQLSGFGTFETKDREARVGRNPHTKEAIDIPATVISATPTVSLHQVVSHHIALSTNPSTGNTPSVISNTRRKKPPQTTAKPAK